MTFVSICRSDILVDSKIGLLTLLIYSHSDSECGQLSQESELDRQYEGRARKGCSQEDHNGHSARYTDTQM